MTLHTTLTCSLMAMTLSATVDARSIEQIQDSGEIRIAVKADYVLYGYKSSTGENQGLEIDLARDVAARLGVKAAFIEVTSATRMKAVIDGEADLLIATMTDRPDRREKVYTIDIPYYSSGTNILAAKTAHIQSWPDLKDRTLCGNHGAYYNGFTETAFGAKVNEYGDSLQALAALKSGQCDGYVFDDSFILGKLSSEEWSQHYEMPLPTVEDAPWGLAVQHGQQDLYDFMTQTVMDWHKSGYILDLERKHGIRNTPFAQNMHKLFE